MESAVPIFEALTAFAIFTVIVLFGVLLAITIQIALVIRSLVRKAERFGAHVLRDVERMEGSLGGTGMLAALMFLARQWRKQSRGRGGARRDSDD